LKIKDTGLGISSEGITQLFQDFSKLKEHQNSNHGGTGLGLSICKQLI
jgi:two-component system sensor histidine kinase EvgS